jgi:hypothetical protein
LRSPTSRDDLPTGEAARTEGPALTRVMLVEDHPDFRDLMVALLEGQPDLEVVAQAGSLAEARSQAATATAPT